MIVRKTWERLTKDAKGVNGRNHRINYLDTYDGWFLFGIIPLYVTRARERR